MLTDTINMLLAQAADQDMDLHTAAQMPAAEPQAPHRRPRAATTTRTTPDARSIIARLVALEQASPALLADAVAECWARIHEGVEDRQHCTPAQAAYIDQRTSEWARLLDVSVDECRAAIEENILRGRLRIIGEVVDRYAAELRGGQRQADPWNPLEAYNRFGLDAMLDLPPRGPDDDCAHSIQNLGTRGPRPAVRVVAEGNA